MMKLIEISELDKLSLEELQDYHIKLTDEAEAIEKYIVCCSKPIKFNFEASPTLYPLYEQECPMASQLRKTRGPIMDKIMETNLVEKQKQALQLKCYLAKYNEYVKSKVCISIEQTIIY